MPHQSCVISLGLGTLRRKKQYLEIWGNMKRVRGKRPFRNNGLHSRPSTFVTNVKLCRRNNRSENREMEQQNYYRTRWVLQKHFNPRFKRARSREICISPVRMHAKAHDSNSKLTIFTFGSFCSSKLVLTFLRSLFRSKRKEKRFWRDITGRNDKQGLTRFWRNTKLFSIVSTTVLFSWTGAVSFFIFLFSKSKPPPKATSEYWTYYHKQQSRRPSVDIFQNNIYPCMVSLAETTTVVVSLCLKMDYFEDDNVSLECFFLIIPAFFPRKRLYFFLHIDAGVGTAVT